MARETAAQSAEKALSKRSDSPSGPPRSSRYVSCANRSDYGHSTALIEIADSQQWAHLVRVASNRHPLAGNEGNECLLWDAVKLWRVPLPVELPVWTRAFHASTRSTSRALCIRTDGVTLSLFPACCGYMQESASNGSYSELSLEHRIRAAQLHPARHMSISRCLSRKVISSKRSQEFALLGMKGGKHR